MDIVTDLTSQCVSFIAVVQEVYKKQLPSGQEEKTTFSTLVEQIHQFEINVSDCNDGLKTRIKELVWASKEDLITDATFLCFFDTCKKIFEWLDRIRVSYDIASPTLYYSAYEWRACIRSILYEHKAERITLIEILQYMPVQIIFCLGGSRYSASEQRMLQIYQPDCKLNPLSAKDEQKINNWWNGKYKENTLSTIKADGSEARRQRSIIAQELLLDDALLLQELLAGNNPVPFENLFIDELDEIVKSREKRRLIKDSVEWWAEDEHHNGKGDPYHRAQSMNLYALAFSGGGIRSATFNLGILQKLAGMGILSRFDYLSTVSGGGYIGSWWAAWIKRSGSIAKVSDRLNPRKSADPLADEVRPIRWLRMFSNYLAPNSSIMSTDSWTMGVTWLRNTTINQVLLLMLLCSTLSVIKGVYGIWRMLLTNSPLVDQPHLYIASGIILVSGGVLAGWGMHAFGPQHPPRSLNIEKGDKLYVLLMIWGVISTFLVSAWLFSHAAFPTTFAQKFRYLGSAAQMGFAAFILVAVLGRYDKCVQPDKKPWEIYLAIFFSSLVAAVCGGLLLSLSWQIFQNIYCITSPLRFFNHKLAFIVGVPLILESISITVVVRMAIMGVLFPDLRREWWGRMGALVHRFIFIWLLVATCALILPDYLYSFNYKRFSFPAIFGGWSAIISYAVKLAYNSKNPKQNSDKGSLPPTEIFIRLAPYLFAIGFLLLGSITLRYLDQPLKHIIHTNRAWEHIFVGLGLGTLTLLLSWRVGVNEFSLHHFYRNRLTRAYLGATRRRELRDKTVNNFTGFDQDDDLLLASLTTGDDYYGPYPIINTTLNSTVVSDLDRQDRKGESFMFTPKYCGFDFSRTRPAANAKTNVYEYGYRPTGHFAYPDGPHLGTAMTISGAAASPNMGYHSSPATAFLLTIFNVRLGWWIGNPRTKYWKSADPWAGIIYLFDDLAGKSDIKSDYVCLSDGGHFDNMGLYELVRRRCRYILLCDAEEDEQTTCEGLANAIRRCRIDFGAEISLPLEPITKKDDKTGYCQKHIVEGKIWYSGDHEPSGTIIYIKTSLTGQESVDIREYFMANPAFPQQSTGDQFFDESQFESYRELGYQSINIAGELKKSQAVNGI